MKEFCGFVIRNTPFRDNDAMVSVLTSKGVYSFLARGVMKFNSKNGASVAPFSKSKFIVTKGKEGNLLRTGQLIDSYENIKNDLPALAALNLISELINKLLINQDAKELYESLERTLCLLNSNFSAFTLALIMFARILSIAGFALDVDECLICGQKSSITAVSYSDGGFICSSCFDPLKHEKADSRKLKIIRYIFKVTPKDYDKITFNKCESVEILKELAYFTKIVSQVEIIGVNLLTQL